MEAVTLLINYGAKWALTNNHNEVAIDFCSSKNVIYRYLESLGLKCTNLKDIERETKKKVALSFVRKKKFQIKVRTELFFPDFIVEQKQIIAGTYLDLFAEVAPHSDETAKLRESLGPFYYCQTKFDPKYQLEIKT